MKENMVRAAVFSVILLVFLASPSVLLRVHATATAEGGVFNGTYTAHEVADVYQDLGLTADALFFTAYSDVDVVGWKAKTSDPAVDLTGDWEWDNKKAVDFRADGEFPIGCTVTIEVYFWLASWNDMWFRDIHWDFIVGPIKAVPDHGWSVANPEFQRELGLYTHAVTIRNADATENFTVTGLTYLASMTYYEDLKNITFGQPLLSNFTLTHGEARYFDVPTPGPFCGGHIYLKYDIVWNGSLVLSAIADHVVTPSVGGVSVPVDKLGLLVPYVGSTTIVLGVTISAVVYVKRARHKKENQ